MAIKVTETLPLHSCRYSRHFIILPVCSWLIPGRCNWSNCFMTSEYISRYFCFKEQQSIFVTPRSLGTRRVVSRLGPSWPLEFHADIFLPGHKEMKGLRTWRNLSETTAPLAIRPKTRGLSSAECREEEKKRERKASLKKTAQQNVVTTMKRVVSLSTTVLSDVAFAVHSSSFICLSSWWETSLWPQQLPAHFVFSVNAKNNSISFPSRSFWRLPFYYLGQIQFDTTWWIPTYLSPLMGLLTSSSKVTVRSPNVLFLTHVLCILLSLGLFL